MSGLSQVSNVRDQQPVALAHISDFTDLRVYRAAMDEASSLFETTKTFPNEERYTLTAQMRRSSRAVGALIAEAWGRRRYTAAFSNCLNQAIAEAHETRAWLEHAHHCGYIDKAAFRAATRAWQDIASMLYRTTKRADKFAGPL